jgi:hypothetical protein
LHSVDYEVEEEEESRPSRPAFAAVAPEPVAAEPVVPAPSEPPASAVPVSRRVRGEELVSAVFDEVHALQFLGDALEAARFCLAVMQSLVPCEAAMVHVFDAERSDFLVVEARGEGAEDMVLKRHEPSDPILRVVMPMGKAFAWNDLSNAPACTLARFATLKKVDRVLAAPILLGGRYLGAIELVNPVDGEDFGFSDENALDYVARHFATFLSQHGVVVDVATVARFAFDRDD